MKKKIITKVFDKIKQNKTTQTNQNYKGTPEYPSSDLTHEKVSPVSFDSFVCCTHAINMSEMIFKLLIYFIIATNVSRIQRNI